MALTANTTPRDDAADAARFLTRLAYAVLAIGAPVGALLHPLALYLLFPIGVAMLVFAAALEPSALQGRALGRNFTSPIALLSAAWLAWAALSILWTPFPVEARQQALRYLGLLAAVICASSLTRPHARATEVYLFAIGVGLIMLTSVVAWAAMQRGAVFPRNPDVLGGQLVATLAFPAMAGLAARGREGLAQALLALSLLFAYWTGSAGVMLSMLAGLTALSFARLSPARAAKTLGAVAAGAIGLAPIAVLIAQPLLRMVFNAKLPSLPPPYPSLAYAFNVVTGDGARLVTGHGFQTMTHGVLVRALPAETPQTALFQVWYELGIVGAWLAAAILWFAFRAVANLPERISPYLAAALTSALALGVACANLDDWTWLMALAIARACGDAAARGSYRTKRPRAEMLSKL